MTLRQRGRVRCMPGAYAVLPALLALVLAIIPTVVAGRPAPMIHDEWGYLLSADTFASGRLTNPTHPLWIHFETIHQMHVPSYQSKYPPGQGLVLAAGQLLWHPISGVWISVAVMVASIAWMLRAWMPARWAFIGGVLAACQLVVVGEPFLGGTTGYWSQSYWGGAVAATGGALFFGALARSLRGPRFGTSAVLGAALLVLANTRPREGLLAVLPAGVLLVAWLFSHRAPGFGAVAARLVVPAALVLVPGFAAMVYYNYRVTGNAFELPWLTHYRQYCIFPIFIWQDVPAGRTWNHEQLRAFHAELELSFHERYREIAGFFEISARKLARFWIFFIGPALTLPLLLLPAALKKPWMRFLCVPIVIIVATNLVTFGGPPHYSAPVAGLVIALVVECLRRVRALRIRGSAVGRALAALVMVGAFAGAVYGVVQSIEDVRHSRASRRNAVQRELEAMPGRHLVIVRYGPNLTTGDEWVFNDADIDGAKIVWAREMGEEGAQRLLEYFPGRRAWLMKVGYESRLPVPVPYPER